MGRKAVTNKGLGGGRRNGGRSQDLDPIASFAKDSGLSYTRMTTYTLGAQWRQSKLLGYNWSDAVLSANEKLDLLKERSTMRDIQKGLEYSCITLEKQIKSSVGARFGNPREVFLRAFCKDFRLAFVNSESSKQFRHHALTHVVLDRFLWAFDGASFSVPYQSRYVSYSEPTSNAREFFAHVRDWRQTLRAFASTHQNVLDGSSESLRFSYTTPTVEETTLSDVNPAISSLLVGECASFETSYMNKVAKNFARAALGLVLLASVSANVTGFENACHTHDRLFFFFPFVVQIGNSSDYRKFLK